MVALEVPIASIYFPDFLTVEVGVVYNPVYVRRDYVIVLYVVEFNKALQDFIPFMRLGYPENLCPEADISSKLLSILLFIIPVTELYIRMLEQLLG